MQLAGNTFQRMRQQATLINLPEFDWPLGHVNGAALDMKDATTLMQGFDRDLAMLEDTYRKAGVLDKTVFVLTADHGFSPIYHEVPKSVIADAVAKTGTSIIRDTYHTGAYLWLKDESRAVDAAAAISRAQNPYIQSVYFRTTGPDGPGYIRASGTELLLAPGMEEANQHLLHTFNGPNGPDLVVFMKEHAAAVAGGQGKWKGDHGGADWESQHVPLFISGPGVRSKAVSDYPAKLMDVAPTALRLLGVPATEMHGVVLADSLRSASAPEQAAQRERGSTLAPVISALKAEAGLEAAQK
jgi:arylsulfatase A-like enzyme